MIQDNYPINTPIEALIIRHGESGFNEATDRFQTFFVDDVHSELAKRQFQFDRSLLDSPLTAVGRDQALKARNRSDLIGVDIVFVSPLKRALQTADLMFKEKDVRFIVLPELTEILSKICDISSSIEEKKKEFPKMDFSHFKGRQATWQLDLLPESQRQRSKMLLGKLPSNEQITNHLFQLLQANFPSSMEPRPACTQRVRNSKSVICKISRAFKASKIAIVAHRRVVIQMTKTPSQPEGLTMKNCESRALLIQ